MTDTLHEALKDFRSDFEPTMKAMLTQLTRTTTLIMRAYEDIINTPYDTADDITTKKEDTAFLAELRRHHDLLIHSVTYELDALQTIGAPRKVERYFNFENGDMVEVDKEHFAGLPDDDTEGRVLAFGHAPEL